MIVEITINWLPQFRKSIVFETELTKKMFILTIIFYSVVRGENTHNAMGSVKLIWNSGRGYISTHKPHPHIYSYTLICKYILLHVHTYTHTYTHVHIHT